MTRHRSATPGAVIYGAGGHGAVVAETMMAAGLEPLGFIDDQVDRAPLAELPMIPPNDPGLNQAGIIVAIGSNAARRKRQAAVASAGQTILNVIHPDATLSPTSTIGVGVYIGARAVINTQAVIDDGVIVNTGAIIEHHVRVGAFAHVAPGAALGGNAAVGEGAMVGLGANVLPGVSVGAGAVVGAGATVTHDVPEGQTVVGIPARVVQR